MASIKKRPNDQWRARYRDQEGKEHARHFPRKVDAQRWLDEVTTSIVTGQYVAPDAGKVTFKSYAETWRAAQIHRPNTVTKVESLLRLYAYPAFGDRPIGSILPSEVQAWVKGLDLAPSTVAVVHGVVAGIFKAAIADRRIVASPCAGTRLPAANQAEVVPLELEQVAKLTAALPAHLRALVTLTVSTGLRQGEVFGLTVDRSGLRPPSVRPELRVDRQLVTVQGEGQHLGPPKTKAGRRTIPLPSVAVDALAAHLAEFPAVEQSMKFRDGAKTWTEPVEFVFTTPHGSPLRRSHYTKYWQAALKDSGCPAGTRFHDLRHFYASLLIRHGESVKVVQARLGHATAAETLDTYSHLWPDSEDRTRLAIDSVLRPAADSVRTEQVAE
jgi:integrase